MVENELNFVISNVRRLILLDADSEVYLMVSIVKLRVVCAIYSRTHYEHTYRNLR